MSRTRSRCRVAVRTTKSRRLLQIHANPRQPALLVQAATAVAEVNRRKLRLGKRLLIFGRVETGPGGS